MHSDAVCVKKMMKAERWAIEDHTSRHTSPEGGDARDSRKGTALSSRRLPAFIFRSSTDFSLCFGSNVQPVEARNHRLKSVLLRKKGISIVKKRIERALSLPGKLPAPFKSRDFVLRFGSGSPLPRLMPDVTAIYGPGRRFGSAFTA
jgi:hypothetical protein